MPGNVGTLDALAAVWPLRLEPSRKLYLMALSETLDPVRAAELACLSLDDAAEVRMWLDDAGLIAPDGNVDIQSARTWPDRVL